MTCRHVSILGRQHTRSISTGIQSFHATDIQHPVAIKEVLVDYEYLNKLAQNDRGMKLLH